MNHMLAALSLFLVISGPLPARNNLLPVASPAIAMARDQRGVVVAWTMRNDAGLNRIYVTRVDATGAGDGHAREMPLSTTLVPIDASCPSIAPSPGGSGFTIAWMELPSVALNKKVQAAYTRLDADLNPATPSLLRTIDVDALEAPAIVRSGASTWITFDKSLWKMFDDGTLSDPLDVGFNASDMVANAAYPRLIGKTPSRLFTRCKPECLIGSGRFTFCSQAPNCTIVTGGAGYSLTFLALYSSSTSAPFPFESATRPAIGSDGRATLVAWYRDGEFVINRFDDAQLSNFPDLATRTPAFGPFDRVNARVRPDIASDGVHDVVVWQTSNNDIVGASIDATGKTSPFTVAATDADEHEPSVIAVRPGLFFVAYEKISGTDRRIAGEFITFDGRERPVR